MLAERLKAEEDGLTNGEMPTVVDILPELSFLLVFSGEIWVTDV
jgi:hypothetical protein